ncbi:MAG: hypothetical protein KFB97_00385 [Cyanobium sp. M30B3]|nr:MAG: hypothetical protein KFB97_00385 [Cyanobium sp. M30B3]
MNQPSSNPSKPSSLGWWWDLLPLWALALGLSAALVAAGKRLSQPLTPEGPWVGLLVLGVPLLMGLVLAARWRFAASPGHPDRGESGD